MKFLTYLFIAISIYSFGQAAEEPKPEDILSKVRVVNGYEKVKAPQNKNFFVYHEEYTPKENFNRQTVLLIPGYSKTTDYFDDFILKTDLLKQGYRVVVIDPMLRGKTLKKNFPIENIDGEFKFDPSKKRFKVLGFNDPTAEREAEYLLQFLVNKKYKNLTILGHSRGAYIGAVLSHYVERRTLINLNAFIDMNGFVSYTNGGKPFSHDLKSQAAETTDQYIRINEWLYSGVDSVYEEDLRELRTKILKNLPITRKEATSLSRIAEHIIPHFPWHFDYDALLPIETSFITHLYQDAKAHAPRLENTSRLVSLPFQRVWTERERLAFESMMKAQRTIVHVESSLFGGSSTYVIPRSSLPYIDKIKAPILSIVGEKDNIVDSRLSELKLQTSANVNLKMIPGGGHYGPENLKSIVRVKNYLQASANQFRMGPLSCRYASSKHR